MISAARTATWHPTPRGSSIPPVLAWPSRYIGDVLPYYLDMTGWVADSGDAIVSATATPSPVDLVCGPVVALNNIMSLVIGGGTPRVYAVTFNMLSASGSTDQEVVSLPTLLSNTTAPPPPNLSNTTTTGTVPGSFGPLPSTWPAGSSVSVRGNVVARNTTTGDTMSWDVAALARGIGTSGIAIVQQSVAPYQADAAMLACAIVVVTSGTTVAFSVTGVAGATIAWSGAFTWTVA